MQIFEGDIRVAEELRQGALALGNFDGVHLGHQAVIGRAVAIAHAEGRPALVATFDPHPSRLFRPDTPPFSLTSLDQKIRLFTELGADGAIIIPFNRELAALSAQDFIQQWLIERLGVAHVITGEDFTFGQARSGNARILAQLGQDLGLQAETVSPVSLEGEVVSSTRIREALIAGHMQEAARLLTRPFAISGTVMHGDKRGRTIGIPTINQNLEEYLRPRFGVYAVRVKLPDGAIANGVANLGIRPMFEPPIELLETWILDWSGDLYGQQIEVELVAWLRPEMKLDGLDALKAQIALDEKAARALLQPAA